MNVPIHSLTYRYRRALNWVPLGLAYAFFYMGRYNLTVAKTALGENLTKAEFGTIFAIGAWVYGLSFLFTGPLTDKLGGRRAMLIGTMGTLICNVLMGLVLLGITQWGWAFSIFGVFSFLYAINMHFQSYGAIAIVTVNAPWFHYRERGAFSTVFGTMIALGVFFAFDWGYGLVAATRGNLAVDLGLWGSVFHGLFGTGGMGIDENWWIFFAPAVFLGVCWFAMYFILRDSPGQAGFADFDRGESSISADGQRLPISKVFFKIITHPVLIVICGIEFCSGVLRNGIMHWYPLFASELGFKNEFWITQNWGLVLLIAGVLGALLTGWASDKLFQSRRAPMAAILYGVIMVGVVWVLLSLGANPWHVGIAASLVSMAVIGVHGIMSGTSTADFGGAKNVGAAVGIVDGMVYLGTGIQSFVIGNLTPVGEAAKTPQNWIWWPLFLVPFSLIGLLFALRIWNALPGKIRAVPASAFKGTLKGTPEGVPAS